MKTPVLAWPCAVLALSLCGFCGATAAQTAASLALVGRMEDLGVPVERASPGEAVATGVRIRQEHLPSTLRFRVSETAGTPAQWWIEFRIGSSASRVESRAAFSDYYGSTVLDVPVREAGDLLVTFGPAAPSVTLIARIDQNRTAAPLYQQGRLNLDYFDRDFASDAARQRLSRATVLVKFETARGPATCTAYQIAPGLFLTNLHCIESDARSQAGRDQNRLYFGLTLERGEADAQSAGDVVNARMVAKGKFVRDKPREHYDYAVLEASTPKSYERDVLPLELGNLDAVLDSNPRPLLELYQHWTGTSGTTAGKALSADEDCKVLGPVNENGPVTIEQCPYPSFKHGCDTDEGSSGSPILRRKGDRAVGVHFLGQVSNYNCALRADALLAHLKGKYLQVWERVVAASKIAR